MTLIPGRFELYRGHVLLQGYDWDANKTPVVEGYKYIETKIRVFVTDAGLNELMEGLADNFKIAEIDDSLTSQLPSPEGPHREVLDRVDGVFRAS